MSIMQIEVVNVSVSNVPTKTGSYQVADVAYKNKSFQDKLEGKKVMSFVNKDVFATLSTAKFGDVFYVQRSKVAGKDGKEYWNWDNLSTGSVDGVASAPTAGVSVSAAPSTYPVKTGNASPKSTYETTDERAARQVLIVRQSSISSAVEFAVANKLKTTKEVLAIAKEFEDYVFGKETIVAEEATPEQTGAGGVFADFEDDLP